jgi:hypothetical protein
MGGGQDYSSLPLLYRLHEIRPTSVPAAAIAPTELRGVKPTAVGQAANPHAVRSTASLTNASSALEPDPPADLRPIARIERAHFRSDRHQNPVAATPVHKRSVRSQSHVQCQAVAQRMETSILFYSLSKSKSGRHPNRPQQRPSGRSGGSRTKISVRPSRGMPR